MNVEFSRVIQGCMTWGSWGKQLTKNEMVELMNHDIECGITSFDHADIYGDYTTEIAFGKAFYESSIARESIEIISKCGIQYVGKTRKNEIKHYQYDADYIIWSAEKSIKDLQCDYLDLLLLHRPSPLMQANEVAKAIDKLTTEGKIKSFGVSNFTQSQTALINSKNNIQYNQIEFSLTAHQALFNGSLDNMMLQNITPMCWSPLGTIFKERNEQNNRIHTVMDSLSEKYNASKDQLTLAWIMKHPSKIYPVIGTTNKTRIKNAIEASKIALTDIDWFTLLVASQGHKVP